MNAQQAVHAQPQSAAPAAPAAPAAQPASEQLFTIQTPDGPRQEPLSVLQDRFIKHSDAERRVMEQNARIQQLEAQNQALAGRAQLADSMNRELVENPEAFVERAQRLARLANGTATPEDRAADNKGQDSRTVHELEAIKGELAQIRQTQAGDAAVKSIQGALANYPLFTNNEAARKVAETTLAAMQITFPNKPLGELASTLHQQMSDMLKGQAQQTYQTRTERQATNPPAVAGQSPGMSNPEPPLTVKDMKDGTLRRRLTNFLNGPHGINQ